MKKKLIVEILIISMLIACLAGCGETPTSPTSVPSNVSETSAPTPTVGEQADETPEPTEVPSDTATPVPTDTATPVPTDTATPVPTDTATPVPTNTNTPVPTNTNTPVPTNTNTPVPTNTNTPVPTNTNTPVPTNTNTPVPTNTNTPVPTNTNTPIPATATPVPTQAGQGGATPSPMPTKTAAQKVSYSDSEVNVMDYSISNDLDTQSDIVAYMVQAIYDLEGLSGYSGSGFFTDKDTIMGAAAILASYKDVTAVDVDEITRYNNVSSYMVTVHATTAFRYSYAIDNKDESYCTDEDLTAISALKQLVQYAAANYSTDYEKEKYFHDYLASTITYDGSESYNQTPYGALIRHKCVCNGYASTFELLLNMSGIPCTFVAGYGNGGNHAWNQVLLGGAWYNVDVTWDDTDNSNVVKYTYMNVDDTSFYTDHYATDSYVPVCWATEYNGILMNYHVCSTQDEANAYCKSKVDAGTTYVEFVYTGADSFSTSSLMNAVGSSGISWSWDTTNVGTVYMITFK